MALQRLRLDNFRCFLHLDLTLNSRCNIFVGPNGSGKTSLLEAIYFLATTRSFRTHLNRELFHTQNHTVSVFGQTESGSRFGVARQYNGASKIHVDGQAYKSNAKLVEALPVHVFHQDLFQIIDAGPKHRRQILDWGVFHVEHDYLSAWKSYQRILKQRNHLLKQGGTLQELNVWSERLVECAAVVHQWREVYAQRWFKAFDSIVSQWTDLEIRIAYDKGWEGEASSLAQCLRDAYSRESKMGYTLYGPHKADVQIHCLDRNAKAVLSRGQQKLILFALKMAQADLVEASGKAPYLYLVDDISAELDNERRRLIANYLSRHKGQFFLTAIENHDGQALAACFEQEAAMFHVKHEGLSKL